MNSNFYKGTDVRVPRELPTITTNNDELAENLDQQIKTKSFDKPILHEPIFGKLLVLSTTYETLSFIRLNTVLRTSPWLRDTKMFILK